jgi:outer membrane receptor for ferrienterochelin and colicin
MVYSFAAALCLLSNSYVYAQTEARITGSVIMETGKPLSSASVILSRARDSSIIKTFITSGSGTFEFEKIKPDSLLVTVSHVGYKETIFGPVNIAPAGVLSIPAIVLKTADDKLLKDVTVTAKKPIIEHKIDRTILNVDGVASNTGSNTLEVLERSPGVVVDENGNISLKGKSGVLVLIDDRPTYLSAQDLATYLKSLPASSIEKIELMTNPPARYDAASGAGVINIITKKNTIKGFNGSLSVSAGQAVYARSNESLNLNYRNGKINIFGNFGYSNQKSWRRLELNRSYFNPAGDLRSEFLQTSFFRTTRNSPTLKAGIDYSLSPKTTLGFVFKGSYSLASNPSPVKSLVYNNNRKLDSLIEATNYTREKFSSNGLNINFNHQYDSSGKVLTANLDFLQYTSFGNRSFLNNSFSGNGNLKYTEHLQARLPSAINIYSGKADYTHPLKPGVKFEAGVKTSFVDADNAANYFFIIDNSTVVDNDKTNHFTYRENINAAYINFNGERKRFGIQAGLRMEQTNSNGYQSGNAVKPDSSFTKTYTNLFPTGYLSYKLDSSGNNYLNLSYGRRVNRPYYQDLNPFIFLLDKFAYFAGNPYLRPQFSNNYEFSYHYKSFLTASLLYNHATDLQQETIYQSGNVFISTTGNIGRRIYKGISVNANLKPYKFWSASIYTEVINNRYKGVISTSSLLTNATFWYLNMNNQFTFNKGWGGELSGFYVTRGTDGQFIKQPVWILTAAVQKAVFNKKGTFRLSVRDIFHTLEPRGKISNIPSATATYHNYLDTQVATLGFTYSFGKTFKAISKRSNNSPEEESRIKN